MTPEERERMNELCVEIQQEKNFHRYEELIRELSSLVEKKERRFPERQFSLPSVAGKGWKFMPAAVTKVIPTVGGVEKVEIQIPEADDLFREIRVENSFEDWQGNTLAIRAGAAPARYVLTMFFVSGDSRAGAAGTLFRVSHGSLV